MNRINNSDEKLQLKEEGSPSLHDIHNISFTIMNLYRKYNSNLSHHWQDILVWAKVVINWLSDVAIPTAMRIHFPMITIYLARHTLLITYFSFCAFLWCVRGEITEARLRDKQSETNIMHGVSTLQGSKAYQRLARLHWAAAVA